MGKKPIPNNLFIAFVYKYDVLRKNIVIIERLILEQNNYEFFTYFELGHSIH